jgi:hypothetical protein
MSILIGAEVHWRGSASVLSFLFFFCFSLFLFLFFLLLFRLLRFFLLFSFVAFLFSCRMALTNPSPSS